MGGLFYLLVRYAAASRGMNKTPRTKLDGCVAVVGGFAVRTIYADVTRCAPAFGRADAPIGAAVYWPS